MPNVKGLDFSVVAVVGALKANGFVSEVVEPKVKGFVSVVAVAEPKVKGFVSEVAEPNVKGLLSDVAEPKVNGLLSEADVPKVNDDLASVSVSAEGAGLKANGLASASVTDALVPKVNGLVSAPKVRGCFNCLAGDDCSTIMTSESLESSSDASEVSEACSDSGAGSDLAVRLLKEAKWWLYWENNLEKSAAGSRWRAFLAASMKLWFNPRMLSARDGTAAAAEVEAEALKGFFGKSANKPPNCKGKKVNNKRRQSSHSHNKSLPKELFPLSRQ